MENDGMPNLDKMSRARGDELFKGRKWTVIADGWRLRFVDDEMPYIVLTAIARFSHVAEIGHLRGIERKAWSVEIRTGAKLDTSFATSDLEHLETFVERFFADVVRANPSADDPA